ncbi:hypothetical protein [Kitasatospora aureofaciens]|uniref:hypothetical protein n=1 Tax=Kitasatospora aureofaciens TaxID=1894 RepID=UPI0036F456D3
MFEMTRALNGEHGGPGNIVIWIVGQLGMSCLAMALLWMGACGSCGGSASRCGVLR